MRPALRLTKRHEGGFRLEGAAAAAIEAVPQGDGFLVGGAPAWRLRWNEAERGWVLIDRDGAAESGRTTASAPDRTLGPSSVLLADGRLFRLAFTGASRPQVELGRYDVPGAYARASASAGGWTIERTPAGESLPDGAELWILACAEIGRLDGWW